MYSIDLVQKESLFGPWTLCPETMVELDYRLYTLKPKVVIECGSGISTLVLAKYAKNTGAKIYSYEHNPFYYNKTKKLLGPTGLSYINLILCDLSKDIFPTYTENLPSDIDFALIDGPPLATGGRRAILPWIYPKLSKNWEIWLDDGDRNDEKKALELWKKDYEFSVLETKLQKGVVILTNRKQLEGYKNIDDIFISILSGSRPELLQDTLQNLPFYLLKNITGLCNGGDLETLNVYSKHNIEPVVTSKILTIGDSFSLLANLAKKSGKKYWLSMEDDWKFITLDINWLKRAKECLKKANQVRFRHYSDRTLPFHQVTKKPIEWKKSKEGLIGHAHWTNNPFLMKCSDIDYVYPMLYEKDAQTKALKAGKDLVYQLYPGCFVHTGYGKSLKTKLGRTC